MFSKFGSSFVQELPPFSGSSRFFSEEKHAPPKFRKPIWGSVIRFEVKKSDFPYFPSNTGLMIYYNPYITG